LRRRFAQHLIFGSAHSRLIVRAIKRLLIHVAPDERAAQLC